MARLKIQGESVFREEVRLSRPHSQFRFGLPAALSYNIEWLFVL